ncbi:MAG: hypothetical protein VB042_08835 [Victivallaceae bacterium]|nr:hypothetical protein [Victivallaceae bacterium]
MNIVRILTIGGEPINFTSMALTLDRDAPGRGVIVAQTPKNPEGEVAVDAGIDGDINRYFTGYIESAVRVDGHQIRLYVREFSGVLEKRCPVALRNVKISDCVAAVAGLTGLKLQGLGPWLERPVARFLNLGSGFDALREIGQLSGLEHYVARPMPKPWVWLGDRAAIKNFDQAFEFPTSFFTAMSVSGGDCRFVPQLRPGMRLWIGGSEEKVITKLDTAGATMRINFEKSDYDV